LPWKWKWTQLDAGSPHYFAYLKNMFSLFLHLPLENYKAPSIKGGENEKLKYDKNLSNQSGD